MKLRTILPVSAILLVVLMASCKKDAVNNVSPMKTSSDQIISKTSNALANPNTFKSSIISGVNLGVAGNFEILSKTGITDVYKSAVTGNIGSSPITGAAIRLTCAEVTGSIYSVDAAGPLPSSIINPTWLTSAVSDMQTAYTDAAGRINPDVLNLGAGTVGSVTLTPGLYKWTSAVTIPTDVTIDGGPNDIFILQIAGTLDMSAAKNIILSGGAQAKNIYWVVAGAVTIGTTSHFEGNILGQTAINLKTGASINGRMLAQTAVTLEMNTANLPQ